MAIEGSVREFMRFFMFWVITMLTIYAPHMWKEAEPNSKYWLNLIHITAILPILVNAIARGTRGLDVIAVDWAFLLLALAVTLTFVIFVTQVNRKVKDSVRNFGKNSESTGTTLGLSFAGFIIGILISRKAFDGAMYRHAYAPI